MHISNYTHNSILSHNSVIRSQRVARSAAGCGSDNGLGNNTRSTLPLPNANSLDQASKWQKRRDRYGLQSTASHVLGLKSRVSSCQKVSSYSVQNSGGSRGISKNELGNASFHGVGSCGSVWTCPVCSQRISESRRNEVINAMAKHRENGGICLLITWTFSHSRADKLEDILPAFSKAISRTKGRKSYKKIRESAGYIGSIRALEVTHSNANGWHPHSHEIWFIEKSDISSSEIKEIEDSIFKVWRQCSVKFGLGEPSRKHGIDIQYRDNGLESAGAYIAKWGHELTYSHTKKLSTKKGRSPWAILSDLNNKWSLNDHKLFNEYADNFKGRSQLFWSKGLKELFKINELSDIELSEQPEKIHICDITNKQWSAIIWLKKRADVLEIAETQSVDSVINYMNYLVYKNEQQYRAKLLFDSQFKMSISKSTIAHMQKLNLDWCA